MLHLPFSSFTSFLTLNYNLKETGEDFAALVTEHLVFTKYVNSLDCQSHCYIGRLEEWLFKGNKWTRIGGPWLTFMWFSSPVL